ncbi:MAG TPA: purine-binding chemotaxis protein CheW [Papillibacter sp.]|jgi:purine-binding chemotaxis protein CheW|nr:purine-binding chemotaxis protein CheW [Papillibacter sp.]
MDEILEKGPGDDIREYLIFTVDKIEFGIDIGLVQEIIEYQEASPIPNMLDFCSGIINIRGTIVPVIDMRRKLGFESRVYDDRACIIVITLRSELVGMIVDGVQDVARIAPEQLSDSPAVRSQGEIKPFTSKIANINGNIKQIISIEAVFDVELDGEF